MNELKSTTRFDEKCPNSSGRRLVHLLYLATAILIALGISPAYRFWHEHRTEQYREAAEQAADVHDWKLIREIATRWTDWDENSAEGWFYLSDASRQLGDNETAQEALSRIPKTDARYLEALALRGDILYLVLKRPYDAVDNWRQMLAFNPQADAARQGLISFYALSRQRKKMLDEIREAMLRKCEPKEAYSYILLADNLNFTNGYARVSDWLAAYPNDEHLQVAEAYYSAESSRTVLESSAKGKNDISLEQGRLEKLVEIYPQNLELLALRLEAAVEKGDVQLLVRLSQLLPAEAEEDNRFWRYQCWAYLQLQQLNDAIAAGERALEIHPFDWRARLLLAESLRKTDQIEASKAAAELAAEGKEIERELMELPNPLSLEGNLVDRIYVYSRKIRADLVVRSMQNRGLK